MTKKKIIWVFMNACGFIFLVYWCLFGFESYFTEETQRNGNVGEIIEGRQIEQLITLPGKRKVEEIGIFLATYKRVNDCNLFVNLLKDEQVIQSWTIDCKKLKDNAYYWLKIDESKNVSNSPVSNRNVQSIYTLSFTSDGSKGNAITIYTTDQCKGLRIDGTEDGSICYQLKLTSMIKDTDELFLWVALVIILFLYLLYYLYFHIVYINHRGLKKRDKPQCIVYIEILRILSMIFVVYNHTGPIGFVRFSTYEPGTIPFFSNMFQAVFCKVGVSMYFIISGALMLNRTQEPIKSIFKKRILKYVIILIIISIVYGLSNHILIGIHYTAGSFFRILYSSNIKYHLWFLYAYIGYLIILPLLQSFCKGMENKHFLYLILVHFVFRMISVIEYLFWKDTLTLESHLIATLPVNIVLLPLIGYFLEYRVQIIEVKNKLWILWVANISCVVLSCYLTYIRGVDRGVFSEADSQRYFNYFTFINCITVYLTVKYIFSRIKLRKRTTQIIAFIGSGCFGVYLLHIIIKDLPYKAWIISSLQRTSVPLAFIAFVYVLYLFVLGLALSLILKKLRE